MNKKEQLKKQAHDLLKKARDLEIQEQQKIGKLVMELYEKNEIKDSHLRESVAKILGDISEVLVIESKASGLSVSEKLTDSMSANNE